MTAPWFDAFGAAIDNGSPVYRRCETCGSGGWPPRQTCPSCGENGMVDSDLSPVAEVVSFTDIHVTMPKFRGETPYTVVMAEFEEGVRLTGQLRGTDDISHGEQVQLGVEQRDEHGWVITFTPT